MIRSTALIVFSLATAWAVGCSGDGDGLSFGANDSFLGNRGGDGDSGGDGDGDENGDGDLAVGDGDSPGDGDGGSIDGCEPFSTEGCTGITYEGENVPLDIYVMFDLSCSMSCTVDQSGCCRNSNDAAPESEWRIQPVREAMRVFLEDSKSAGIGVGLGFFGDHDVGDPNNPATCNVGAHEDAAVEIAQLPGSANDLVSTLDAGEPQGGTPTHLAIEGACNYSNNWKQENPAHKVVILLVTDGIPEHSCNADIQQAVAAAEECYGDGAGREIYVLGVVANNNNSLDQLNGIAQAGGTEQAYLTDTNDIAGSVLAALNAIRADAIIPCTLNIPEPPNGEAIDYGQVNIGICDAAGDTVHTYFVEEPADCDDGAWYYDQVGNEQVVQLCDGTCETVSVSGAALTLSVGCETVVTPVR